MYVIIRITLFTHTHTPDTMSAFLTTAQKRIRVVADCVDTIVTIFKLGSEDEDHITWLRVAVVGLVL